jgi:glycosyltransferase involved in cell wall biosynthesis
MPTLSLCIIVKNESSNLAQCLTSVKGLVDEIVIVDTGSADNTKQIAKQFTKNVYDFQWINDFAAARNFSIQHATGDWILILDADETLSSKDHALIRQTISSAPSSIVAFKLILRNYTDDSRAAGWISSTGDTYEESKAAAGWWAVPKIRLFRNNPSIRYSGAIHESVSESVKKIGGTRSLDIPIHHFGKLDVKKEINKSSSYESLSKQKIAKKMDFYSYFELGRQYVHSGKGDEAIKAFEQSTALNPDYFETWFMLGTIYILKGDLLLAFKNLEKARTLNNDFASTYVNLGIICAKQKQHQKAIGYFSQALALNPSDANAYKNLGLCYDDLGDKAQARSAFKKAIELNPTLKEKIKLD